MNIVLIILAPILSMVVGFVWYSRAVFGNMWQKETGLSDEDIGSGPGVGYLVTFIVSAVMGVAFAYLVNWLQLDGLVNGLVLGLIASIFVTASFITNGIFEQKSVKLIAIDAGYFVVMFMILGAVAGLL